MHITNQGDGLIWSPATLLGAILGYVLHWVMSWGEWRKVSGNAKLPFWAFFVNDPPALVVGAISTLILYLSLPLLGQWSWLTDLIGFKPEVNFPSAAVTGYFSNSVAIKFRNISRKIDGSDEAGG